MYDVIIIGAGPAGLMCANNLKTDNYLVLEKNSKPLKKLLITGNGRCNLTNNKSPNEFLNIIDFNKKYLYASINLFGPKEIINYFGKFTDLKEEEDNKIFPKSDKSVDIYNVLTKEIINKIKCNEIVLKIKKEDNYFLIYTNNEIYKSNYLVISTGGASFSHTGSTGDHIKFAKQLNINYIPLYPCETGIILKNNFTNQSGISFNEVIVKFKKFIFKGNLMFTKNGLSGSSIMNASGYLYRNNIKEIFINFLPTHDINNILENNKDKELVGAFNSILTKKFIYLLFSEYNFFHTKIKSISIKDKEFIINEITNKKFLIERVQDLKTAYVTGGGINLKNIDTKTFESKEIKNLYFAGETLDIEGPIGGYNITLALSTGFSVSENLNKKILKKEVK